MEPADKTPLFRGHRLRTFFFFFRLATLNVDEIRANKAVNLCAIYCRRGLRLEIRFAMAQMGTPSSTLTESELLGRTGDASLHAVASQGHPAGVLALQDSHDASVVQEADNVPQRGTLRLVAIIFSLAVSSSSTPRTHFGGYRTWPTDKCRRTTARPVHCSTRHNHCRNCAADHFV